LEKTLTTATNSSSYAKPLHAKKQRLVDFEDGTAFDDRPDLRAFMEQMASELAMLDELLGPLPCSHAEPAPPRTCRATTRAGTPCRALGMPANGRCRNHGGLSTGPKTEAGRERVHAGYRAYLKRQRALEG
jgi:hypothetical protein